MRRKSRYAPKRQEISDMLAAGATYREIAKRLESEGISVNYHGLWEYCQRMDRAEIAPVPKCKTCEERFTVPAQKNRGTVSVCLAGKIYIPGSCRTSPMECPRREQ